MKRTALLIDGGHLRKAADQQGLFPNPDFIERFAHACIDCNGEDLYRILYYDCPPFQGTKRRPISGEPKHFNQSGEWLGRLATRPYFAYRHGELQWRGWRLKNPPDNGRLLNDEDFDADLQQKGVDMRIGLDIATLAHSSTVARLILVTADLDFIPAMKYGRMRGLQIVLVTLPKGKVSSKLAEHADILRHVGWPAQPETVLRSQARDEHTYGPADAERPGDVIGAQVKTLRPDGGYGFVRTHSGEEYFFHFTAVADGVDTDSLAIGDSVFCEVLTLRQGEKAGKVCNVSKQSADDSF